MKPPAAKLLLTGISVVFGALGRDLPAQTAGSDASVLVAFDLRTEPEADLDELVPLTKTTVLHDKIELTKGLALGVLQKAQNSPGLSPRNSTVSWVFYGVGNGSGSGDDSSGNSLAAAIEHNGYFTFTIAPKPGHGLNLSAATLVISHSYVSGGKMSGPTQSAVLSSATGFSADQALAVSEDINNKIATYELSHPGLTNITTPIEFRIYCWRPDGNAIDGSGLSLRQTPGMAVGAGGNVVLSGEVFKLNGR
jgi:hypothetical protein